MPAEAGTSFDPAIAVFP